VKDALFEAGRVRDSLHYARHFGLLTAVIVLLAATGSWWAAGAVSSVGVYGALHASLVVVSLRAAQRPLKRVFFIVAAASLAMLSMGLALAAARFFAVVPRLGTPLALLTVAAAAGASSYVCLTKKFWIRDLPIRAIAILPVGCVAATLATFSLPAHAPAGGLWLVAPWWLAFSAGLWYYDTGSTPAEVI
jgi:hypothetical protein